MHQVLHMEQYMPVDPNTKLCHSVAYYSEKVPKEEKHLCSFDQEMYGMIKAVEHFRKYLLNVEFTIFTNNQALSYQIKLKKSSPQLARLVTTLGEFIFKVKHIKGRDIMLLQITYQEKMRKIQMWNSKIENSLLGTHNKCIEMVEGIECGWKLKIARLTRTSQSRVGNRRRNQNNTR